LHNNEPALVLTRHQHEAKLGAVAKDPKHPSTVANSIFSLTISELTLKFSPPKDIWLLVKTLAPSEPQNSWVKMDVHPTKNGIDRY